MLSTLRGPVSHRENIRWLLKRRHIYALGVLGLFDTQHAAHHLTHILFPKIISIMWQFIKYGSTHLCYICLRLIKAFVEWKSNFKETNEKLAVKNRYFRFYGDQDMRVPARRLKGMSYFKKHVLCCVIHQLTCATSSNWIHYCWI